VQVETALALGDAAAPPLAPWPAYPVNGTAADKPAYQNVVNARNSADMAQIQPWWCNQMYTRQDFPLQEHLALFRHDYFPRVGEAGGGVPQPQRTLASASAAPVWAPRSFFLPRP